MVAKFPAERANRLCAHRSSLPICIRMTLENLYDDVVSDRIVIQYGGSVKPENATEIMNMEEIDGALVGGASLEASKFSEIINF